VAFCPSESRATNREITHTKYSALIKLCRTFRGSFAWLCCRNGFLPPRSPRGRHLIDPLGGAAVASTVGQNMLG
jgi:hypothetical protein